MKECKCEDWKENIEYLDMNYYDGKEFEFCPWCGKKLCQV